MSQDPPSADRPEEPGPAPSEQELETQIQAQADELARLLNRLRGPARNMARRSVVEHLREATTEQLTSQQIVERREKDSFGAFGLLVLFMGLLFLPVIPPMASVFFVVGAGILVLSFLASRFGGGSRVPRSAEQADL